MKKEEIINKYVQKAFDESDNQQYFNTYACAKHFEAGLNHASEVNAQLKEQLTQKVFELQASDSENEQLKEQLAAKERESINFAAYLSVNNYESSNGINYNKFRMEYGSKYIITTKHIDDIYKDFINTPN